MCHTHCARTWRFELYDWCHMKNCSMCKQQILMSVCASDQSDKGFLCINNVKVKTLISMHTLAGWFEYLQYAFSFRPLFTWHQSYRERLEKLHLWTFYKFDYQKKDKQWNWQVLWFDIEDQWIQIQSFIRSTLDYGRTM